MIDILDKVYQLLHQNKSINSKYNFIEINSHIIQRASRLETIAIEYVERKRRKKKKYIILIKLLINSNDLKEKTKID